MRITFTYDIITPESASNGDTAESGFYSPGGWKYPLSRTNKRKREQTLREAQKGEYDYGGTLAEALREAQNLGLHQASESPTITSTHCWFSSVDPDRDYSSGEDTYYHLHIEGVTLSTLKRIDRWLNGKPVLGGKCKTTSN